MSFIILKHIISLKTTSLRLSDFSLEVLWLLSRGSVSLVVWLKNRDHRIDPLDELFKLDW